MRKLTNWISVTVSVKTWTDPETGETRFLLQHTPPLGLPRMSEERALDDEPDEVAVPNIGKLRVRTCWGTAKQLDLLDKYLAQGLERGPSSMIHMMTEHLDIGCHIKSLGMRRLKELDSMSGVLWYGKETRLRS